MGYRKQAALAFVLGGSTLALASCSDVEGLDAHDPARGPGQLVGNGGPVSKADFAGGGDTMPEPRDVVRVPNDGFSIDCGPGCRDYCDSLDLENPVNVGICPSLWGVGLASQPVQPEEACRRLYADMLGRYPTPNEIDTTCKLATWGDTVKALLDTDEFVLVNQRRWADILAYNNRAVNFERAFDMDDLVGKTYQGKIAWDEFAAVASAHPVIMRRRDTPGDRAAFVFETFVGRPPYENERSDLGRLYNLWKSGYWTHPEVGVVPDSFIEFNCVDSYGKPDPDTIGECTSILWDKHTLTLTPDPKRLVHDDPEQEGTMWAGFLKPEEWKQLQMPGRIIAQQPAFWEHAAEMVLDQYLGYDLAASAPEVVHALVQYVLEYNGDVRALHYAVATSFPYLQSARGASPTAFPWTYGPLKQIEVEGWIDSITKTTGHKLAYCDHRLPHPEDYVGPDRLDDANNGWAYALVKFSRWVVDNKSREVVTDYRNLARTLGGCPANDAGGRFTTVSVLNTAVQEAFVAEVCGIGDAHGDQLSYLLPDGVEADMVLDENLAETILTHQQRMWMARWPDDDELEDARVAAGQCVQCSARDFARPLCFSFLSTAEMLFY